MTIEQEIAYKARSVLRNEDAIGVYSTGERCAVALLLGRPELGPRGYTHPLDQIERLGPEWEAAVRKLHRENCWQDVEAHG
jgi:hypothetical protein